MKNLIRSFCLPARTEARLGRSAFWDHLLHRNTEQPAEHLPDNIGPIPTSHRPVPALEQTVERLSRTVAALEARLKAVEATAAHMPANPGGPKRLLLTDRAQALRMARDGKKPGQIAQALGLAQGEVRLLIRVHEFQSQLQDETAGQAG